MTRPSGHWPTPRRRTPWLTPPLRHRLVAVLGALALAVTLVGCGDDEPVAEPTPTPGEMPGGTPTPSGGGTPSEQPEGADGVTFEVLNWDEYAGDPVLLQWKQVFEASQASVNQRDVLPAVVEGTRPKVRRDFVEQIRFAWNHDLHARKRAQVRVVALKTQGRRSTLTVCAWQPGTGYYQANGKPYGGPGRYWIRATSTLVKEAGAWQVSAVEPQGRCPGGAP